MEEQQQTFAQEISLNDDDVSKSRLSRIAVLGYLSLLILDKPTDRKSVV